MHRKISQLPIAQQIQICIKYDHLNYDTIRKINFSRKYAATQCGLTYLLEQISSAVAQFYPWFPFPALFLSSAILFHSLIPFSSSVYLSYSPVSLSFLCVFFHFFIEVDISVVSFFSPVSILINLCILLLLCISYTPLWLVTVDEHSFPTQFSNQVFSSYQIQWVNKSLQKTVEAVSYQYINGLHAHIVVGSNPIKAVFAPIFFPLCQSLISFR